MILTPRQLEALTHRVRPSAQRLLGHTDRRTTRIYLRDKVVPVVPGPVRKPRRAA